MSFGQQQRVAMIRALVQPFDFILVDEPISHLDDNNSKIMGDIMMTEAKSSRSRGYSYKHWQTYEFKLQ